MIWYAQFFFVSSVCFCGMEGGTAKTMVRWLAHPNIRAAALRVFAAQAAAKTHLEHISCKLGELVSGFYPLASFLLVFYNTTWVSCNCANECVSGCVHAMPPTENIHTPHHKPLSRADIWTTISSAHFSGCMARYFTITPLWLSTQFDVL